MHHNIKRLSATAVGVLLVIPHAEAAPNATRGEAIYQSCQDCHSLDSNDVGPKHRGVFGRRAGTVPDYNYSVALRNSGITWNKVTLDKWLTDPQELVPGSRMFFHVDAAQDRADVIEYLKELAK
ncbi:MAG: c-type cytochrome [Hyphomicrobiales bacterium]